MRYSVALLACGLFCTASGEGLASIQLQNATATYSQPFFPISTAIDSSFDHGFNGWAIVDSLNLSNSTIAQTAVFETVSNTPAGAPTLLTFHLHQLFNPTMRPNPVHLVGRFRLSATTDDRSTFADGLDTGGDVSANWTVLTPLSYTSSGGSTLTALGDNSILAGGMLPDTDVYTITALTSLSEITGFRLEVLEDPSLPTDGPGRQPTNGNFVLTEFTVDAEVVPEATAATTWLALGLVVGGVLVVRYRRRQGAA
jgi:hypothetical protein